MEPFRFHLYVCTQTKPEGVPSCPTNGAWGVLAELEREVQARGLDNDVQLTTSGCLGLCDEGPVLVVYPEGVWYRKVKPGDAAAIVDAHLAHGKPVERLVWSDAAAMKAMSSEHRDKFRAMMAGKDKSGMLPDRLEEMARGFMQSRVLLTALELDLFTAVGDGITLRDAANTLNVSERGIGALLHALVSLGLLTKEGSLFRNTAESARYFVQGSRDNHRNGLLHTANLWHRWSNLTDIVRRGTPAERDTRRDSTKHFIAGMERNAKLRAPLVVKSIGAEGVKRVLDLGGGSGAYSIAFAKAAPQAKIDILDLPAVVPLTADYLKNAGVESQVSVRTGDMLTDNYGTGYDLVMLNAICHMFSPEQNATLFRKAAPKTFASEPVVADLNRDGVPEIVFGTYSLEKNGGRLVVQDFILYPEKTGPSFAALFSINMLIGTEGGAAYNEPEYTRWLLAAGFKNVQRVNLPGPSDLIIATKA